MQDAILTVQLCSAFERPLWRLTDGKALLGAARPLQKHQELASVRNAAWRHATRSKDETGIIFNVFMHVKPGACAKRHSGQHLRIAAVAPYRCD